MTCADRHLAKKIYFYRNPDIVASPEKDKIFLFDPNHRKLMVMNSVGYEMFKQCRGVSFELIVRYVIKEYNINDEVSVRLECVRFLKEMEGLGILRRERRDERKKVKKEVASAKGRITRR